MNIIDGKNNINTDPPIWVYNKNKHFQYQHKKRCLKCSKIILFPILNDMIFQKMRNKKNSKSQAEIIFTKDIAGFMLCIQDFFKSLRWTRMLYSNKYIQFLCCRCYEFEKRKELE